ncbi:MAG TPA: glycine betaine ABC transporter substrate-binding protein [Haliangiales bacterium]|nr:glycine betaine ABC transporter substrate-binding protein [Haliangiales bacterium]
MKTSLALVALAACARDPQVVVGSKVFTEAVVLGEVVTQATRAAGVPARHQRQLGGTQVLWKALRAGEIDAYVEYTGTIAQEIFRGRAVADLGAALAAEGVAMSAPLGFNDTYAVGMKEEVAARLGIRTLSDLRAHPELRFGFSNEFLNRADGWPGLRAAYALPQTDVRGLDHDLAYRGLASGALDATDLYSTDAEIRYYGLRVLDDDRAYFPAYRAVVLYRPAIPPRAAGAIAALAGSIDEAAMRTMNARVKLDRQTEAAVAADFLAARGVAASARAETTAERLWATTRDHLGLVAVSLLAAIVLAIPLGILGARRPRVGQVILAVVGVVQTIPSLALLVFMIPILGIGAPPAIVALFLYSLLPIVRNTHAGLCGIPGQTREAAEALGLPAGARLRLVELPMASRSILAGIKTSAVINVGTATLGALVGAGGYGQPILTGIRLSDVGLILEGAIPAAVLALAVQGAFDLVERVVVPRGLRL